MEFGILGPLRVSVEGAEIRVAGAKPRALLGLLLVHANETLSADRLAEDLWEGRPPPSAATTLQTYVWQLRKVLGPDTVQTVGGGYRLVVADDTFDAARFEAGLTEASIGDTVTPASVAQVLREALGWWRGPALADFVGAAWAEPEQARLEELRLVATEHLAEARLALGEHARLVPELERLVTDHPLRERLWAQLMLALYRCGRQADALRAYGRLRTLLRDELGIDPGGELARLEEAVLLQKPELDWHAPQEPPTVPADVPPAALPSGVVTFLLTDVVGSTQLWDRHPAEMADALAMHDEIIRNAVATHDGRVLKARGEGDSTFAVFARATEALEAALAGQRSLGKQAWPPRVELSVRMAIHTGEALGRDGDYYGGAVNRAARLRALAEGGEILASRATADLVADHLPTGVSLVEVGQRELDGLRRQEHVYAVRDGDVEVVPVPGRSAVEGLDEQALATETSRPRSKATAASSRRRRRWGLAALAAVVAAAAVAAAAAAVSHSGSNSSVAASKLTGIAAPRGYVPRYVPTTCPSSIVAVTSDASCAHLVVPQDRRSPNGKQITLLVTSAPPRLAGPTVAPTIDVCGCENLGSSLARDHSELIHVAICGYADSDPELTCPEVNARQVSALTRRSTDTAELALNTDAIRQCRARLVSAGIDPSQYNYDAAAHDLLDLMFARHMAQANFVAFQGFDTEVFTVLRTAPAAVRTVTLENPPPPGSSVLSDPIGDLAGAFNRYVTLCNADPVCEQAYPHLPQSDRSLFASLDVQPPLVTTSNPNGSNLPQVRVLVDGPRSADALGDALRAPSLYPLIPQVIEAANVTTAQDTIAAAVAQGDYPPQDAAWGAEASYICSYEANLQNPQGEAIQAQTLPQFVRSDDAEWTQWCKAWDVADLSAPMSQTVVSNVPALLFRGDLSPDGNPDWIPAIASRLSNVHSVVFRTLGSDLLASGPPCLSTLRRDFLAHPSAPLDEAGCERQSPRIAFVGPTK